MHADSLRFAAFDFDGTLLDSAAAIVADILACWDACGFPPPDAALARRCIGLPWEASVRTLLPGAGPAEIARVRGYYDAVARGERRRPGRAMPERLFPGAAETLAALAAADYVLGIVTSRGGPRVYELLETHGIHGHFLTVKTIDHGPGKPSPYLLLQAMREVGAAAAETVMVGDTVYDIRMARDAGAAAVGVSWGVHPAAELHGAGAHHVVAAFDELPAVIGRLTGAPR